MPSKLGSRKVVRTLEDVDDMVFLITGKRIKNLVARGLELFGEDVKRKVTGEEVRTEDPEGPYNILEVRRDASDIVVRAAYRSLVRKSHPDVGGSPEEFRRIQSAYEKIGILRGWK